MQRRQRHENEREREREIRVFDAFMRVMLAGGGDEENGDGDVEERLDEEMGVAVVFDRDDSDDDEGEDDDVDEVGNV